MNNKLYIGNLSPEVSEADLRQLFSKAGPVAEATVALDPVTRNSRGFGFVTMATPEQAAAALRDFHCYSLGGRYITVTEARAPQEPKGMMSEGFGVGASGSFRPDTKGQQPRRHSSGTGRPGTGRRRGRRG